MTVGKYKNGYQRAKPNMGTIREHNEVVNELPQIGEVVMVEEMVIHCRRWGDEHIIAAYNKARSYVDSWGRPFALKVLDYSKGIDRPLDPHNYVTLQRTNPDGSIVYCTLRTVHIATGSMRLLAYPISGDYEGEDVFALCINK